MPRAAPVRTNVRMIPAAAKELRSVRVEMASAIVPKKAARVSPPPKIWPTSLSESVKLAAPCPKSE